MDPKLLKKARKKYLSSSLAAELVKLDSPLQKGYASTFSCESEIYVEDSGEMHSLFYCRRRWCPVCASINMSSMIERYTPELAKLEDAHFVTLTVRNCSEDKLPYVLSQMKKEWRKIADNARKQGVHFKGIRKTEIKASTRYGYHPHFHIVIEGAEPAEWLLNQWLKRFPKHTSKKGQDIKRIDDIRAAAIEIMKYTTKLTCADDTRNEPLCSAKQMDVIFRAAHKKRLIQTFGGFRGISEDAFDIESQEVRKAAGLYRWNTHDWWHVKTGEALSEWTPEGSEVEIYRCCTRRPQ